jgi:hypothetical protein
MKKVIIIFFFIGEVTQLQAQLLNEILNYDYRISQTEKHIGQLQYEGHSTMKPMLFNDPVYAESAANEKSYFYLSTFNISNKFKFSVIPLGNLAFGKSFTADTAFYSLAGGIRTDFLYNEKWYASAEFYTDNSSYPSYLGNYISANEIVPSGGTAFPTQAGYSFTQASGFIAYTPNSFFEFKAGVGKNFIGHGYRSLLLSDNASMYPYARINTTFWKLRYTNLYCLLDDVKTRTGFANNPIRKFSTIHFLDWNISKRMNVGIFESVVWQSKDTLYNRGFEINYLNPVIFYRTVEYSLGSSDNSILGLNAGLKINDHYQLYAQFVLDEFLLSKVLAGNGWWGNKYGVQIGAKAIEPFNIENLFLQTEFNVVRPFTFSHGSPIQNYGHHNQPLAHPIGANFWETVSMARYKFKNFVFSTQFNTALFGTDSTSALSYGGDIYQSNRNRAREDYNRIGQGISNYLFYNRSSVAWILNTEINLRIELAFISRKITNHLGSFPENFITFSLKTDLRNSYTDF